MGKNFVIILFIFFTPLLIFGQQNDSTKANDQTSDSTKSPIFNMLTNTTRSQFLLMNKPELKKPTLPPMGISSKARTFDFNISNQPYSHPEEATNYDALNMPTTRVDYEMAPNYIDPIVPLIPLNFSEQKIVEPMTIHNCILPTRQELDILELLWTKEDVTDLTLYSCLDTTMNITMADLNKLLGLMERKNLVSRKIVSPRNEFNAFGILIEMSPQNLRNRIYEYHSNVSEDVMKTFIDANAYLVKEDSSIVNLKRLYAARKDSTLLYDLNTKIKTIKNPD